MNCLTACLRHLLGPKAAECPDFTPLALQPTQYWEAVEEWLHSMGLDYHWIEGEKVEERKGRYLTILRHGPTGELHSVVYRDGDLEYDPNPELTEARRSDCTFAGIITVYLLDPYLA